MPKSSKSSRKKVKNKDVRKNTERKQSSNIRCKGQDRQYSLRSKSQTVREKEKPNQKTKSQSNQKENSQLRTARGRSKSVQPKTKAHSSNKKQKTSSRQGCPKTISICSRARSGSPSPSRTCQTDLTDVIKDLKKRIKSIPIKDRPTPKTNDVNQLGFELKTRLAMTSPVITETGQRGGRTRMYTFVPRVQRENHRPRGNKPSMEVIDHRKRQNTIMGGVNNRIMARSLPTEQSALEIVMDQRNELFDNEIGYKRRIRELETDSERMAAELERALAENRSLKNSINRGPDRADVKKLQSEKKTLKNVIEKLGEENIELNEILNRIVKNKESEWDDVFEAIRRRQEERYSVIGPFISRVQGLKKRTVTVNDGPEKNKDDFDSHLTSVEKETNSLLRRLKQLKREKKVIDYSLVTGERKCVKNMKEFKEVGENLNRDLNKYTAQLDRLSGKHEEMIEDLQIARGLHDIGVQTEPEEKDEDVVDKTPRKKKKGKKKGEKLTGEEAQPMKNTVSLPVLDNVETLVERQRTIIKASDNPVFKNNEIKETRPIPDEKRVIGGTIQNQPLANISKASVQDTNKNKNDLDMKGGATESSSNDKNGELGDLEKELAKNKRTRKMPEDAGSTNMAKLVSPAIGKAPHR